MFQNENYLNYIFIIIINNTDNLTVPLEIDRAGLGVTISSQTDAWILARDSIDRHGVFGWFW